jgi:hypothetical protein
MDGHNVSTRDTCSSSTNWATWGLPLQVRSSYRRQLLAYSNERSWHLGLPLWEAQGGDVEAVRSLEQLSDFEKDMDV